MMDREGVSGPAHGVLRGGEVNEIHASSLKVGRPAGTPEVHFIATDRPPVSQPSDPFNSHRLSPPKPSPWWDFVYLAWWEDGGANNNVLIGGKGGPDRPVAPSRTRSPVARASPVSSPNLGTRGGCRERDPPGWREGDGRVGGTWRVAWGRRPRLGLGRRAREKWVGE